MMERIIFALQEAMKHKAELRVLPYQENITQINWRALHQSGVRVVVLDFDGVLAEDDAVRVRDEIFPLLNHIRDIFGEHIYILSNKPKEERQTFFALNFSFIHFVVAKKKPYPDGLLEIIQREQIDPQDVVLIDDRVLTGGLASILAKTRCILIEKPYVCFANNFIRECLFMSMRAVERLFFR